MAGVEIILDSDVHLYWLISRKVPLFIRYANFRLNLADFGAQLLESFDEIIEMTKQFSEN